MKSVTKRKDFNNFVIVVEIIERKEHLTIRGMRKIAKIVENMTHRKPFKQSSTFKFLSSSETIRQAKYFKH